MTTFQDVKPKDKTPEPVKITPPKRSVRSDSKPRGRTKNLTPKLEEFFTSIGTMVYLANEVDGLAIIEGTPALAKSLNELAKENDAVRKNLERMLTGSAYGGVIMSVGAIALPILANHNLLPVQLPSHMMPDVPKGSSDGNSN